MQYNPKFLLTYPIVFLYNSKRADHLFSLTHSQKNHLLRKIWRDHRPKYPKTAHKLGWRSHQSSLAEMITKRIQTVIKQATTTDSRRSNILPPLPFFIKNKIKKKRSIRRLRQSAKGLIKRTLNQLSAEINIDLTNAVNDIWETGLRETDDDWSSFHRLCRQIIKAPLPVRPLRHEDVNVRYRAEDRAKMFAWHLERQFSLNPLSDPNHVLVAEEFLKEYLTPPVSAQEDPMFFSPHLIRKQI